MAVSLQLNPTDPIRPIFYDPLFGGLEFVVGQLAFNLIGYFILGTTIIQQKRREEFMPPNPLTMIAVSVYFVAPFVVWIQRILQLLLQPFNLLILLYELGLMLHLLSFVFFGENAAFRPDMSLQSISIIDSNTQTIIAGYSSIRKEMWTKLSSMVAVATDAILNETLNPNIKDDEMKKYAVTYGTATFLKSGDYIAFALFDNPSSKLGRRLAGLMVRSDHITRLQSPADVRKLVLKFFHPFFQNREKPDISYFFFQRPV